MILVLKSNYTKCVTAAKHVLKRKFKIQTELNMLVVNKTQFVIYASTYFGCVLLLREGVIR